MDEYMSAVQAAAERSNAFNAQQAQINRDWQAMMSNTAHQREVADLKAAGLNPVLSANSGASAPSGAQASANDTSGSIAGLIGQMISANSAQTIANAQMAHDIFMAQHYPSNLYGAGASLLNVLNPGLFTQGQGAKGLIKQVAKTGKSSPMASPLAWLIDWLKNK